MNNLTLILTSTVIASIISTIFSFLNSRKNNSLQYITGERKEWRKEIREIAIQISNSNPSNIQTELTRLKVRLNPMGDFWSDDFTEDSHIWQLIREFENPEEESCFEDNKLLLIDYLSILLKGDWERSKAEVRGEWTRLLSLLFNIFIIAAIWYLYMYEWKIDGSICFLVLTILIGYITTITHKIGNGDVYGKINLNTRFIEAVIANPKKMFSTHVFEKVTKNVIPPICLLIIYAIYIYYANIIEIESYIVSWILIILLIVTYVFININLYRNIFHNRSGYLLCILHERTKYKKDV